MILLIQRVLSASVKTDHHLANIHKGLCVYVSFEPSDTPEVLLKMAEKIALLRIFDDAEGKLNHSLKEIQGQLLLIPNFTLAATALKGHRPSFSKAKAYVDADDDFDLFYDLCSRHVPTEKGVFGGDMIVETTNEGPVNIIIRSHDDLSN
jgi:D-tyrosyl-tRNA(Tyr) deacylase